jgi:hypothetical protein
MPRLLPDRCRPSSWMVPPLAASLAAFAATPSSGQSTPVVRPLTKDAAKPNGRYRNFGVAIYIPVRFVQPLAKRETLERQWDTISRQLKVDKVYIESHRDRVTADDGLIEELKRFFAERGVRAAGGLTFSDGAVSGQFRSFCYTNAEDRAWVQHVTEAAARHFDEIILDDFFFVTTKHASDIAAKGSRSWSQFRVDLMNEAAENLILRPARAVNPRVKVVIKYPNWYEHFEGLGFDLDLGPRLFDGIYTGTETRDPVATDQFLQQYESYQIYRYFENIAPGRNGGGWVDTFALGYLDRYAEQLWDTMFAKAPEMTLFNWAALLEPVRPGERSQWQAQPTSFNLERMLKYRPADVESGPATATMARVAGYSLEQIDAFLGKLGRPIGIASYKPHHSTGEDFLHNYIGMLGIPIDLRATFPADAELVLLTEAAKADPELVAKIKAQLAAGKRVIITSGLLHALRGKGIEDLVELEYTERRVLADGYSTGFGAGNRVAIGDQPGVASALYPQIRFHTNDAWALVSIMSNKVGFPMLLMDRYDKGVLYVWTIPDNFHHLYSLPEAVATAVRDVVMKGFPVRLDGPSQVALFAYDNHTFIVQSFLPTLAEVRVSVPAGFTKLRNVETDVVLDGRPAPPLGWWRQELDEPRVSFDLRLLPHSYAVFSAEK